jgi:hypothetical protein
LVGGVFFLQQPVIGGLTLVATMSNTDGEPIRPVFAVSTPDKRDAITPASAGEIVRSQ